MASFVESISVGVRVRCITVVAKEKNICFYHFRAHNSLGNGKDFKTSGAFVPGTGFLLVTDSAGVVSLYDHTAF